VKKFTEDSGLPVFQPDSLKQPGFLDEMRSLQPDAFVVVAFRILPRELFSIPRYGSLNIHPSLLPKGRGPAPIQWTLLRGETITGVSIIQLTEQIDGGGILKQESTPVGESECFGDLHDRLAAMGAKMMVEVLDRFQAGESLTEIEQDDSQVTNAPKLFGSDFKINWNESSDAIVNRIRALSPKPGASALLKGEPFKILRAKPYRSLGGSPGAIHYVKPSMIVETKQGGVELLTVKPQGKNSMQIEEYLRGCRIMPEQFDLI
jgi:methionyl-tRNA formyltransferase